MGLFIIRKKGGSGSEDLREFKEKAKSLKRLATEVCESIEEMEAEYGGGEYAERGNDSYREGYRRGMEEAEMRRRHGGY
jgi:hypothetical protein